jgi:hypothetical protein
MLRKFGLCCLVDIGLDEGSVRLVYVNLLGWVKPSFASHETMYKKLHVSLTNNISDFGLKRSILRDYRPVIESKSLSTTAVGKDPIRMSGF